MSEIHIVLKIEDFKKLITGQVVEREISKPITRGNINPGIPEPYISTDIKIVMDDIGFPAMNKELIEAWKEKAMKP